MESVIDALKAMGKATYLDVSARLDIEPVEDSENAAGTEGGRVVRFLRWIMVGRYCKGAEAEAHQTKAVITAG